MRHDEFDARARVLQLDLRDDVAVAVTVLARGGRLFNGPVVVVVREDIPAGHVVAQRAVGQGVAA